MTAVYDKLGLKFMYPENWKLADSGDESVPHEITVDSPDGAAMWSVHLYPKASYQEWLLDQTLDSLRETYPDLEVSTVNTSRSEEPSEGIEALFYCLDFLIRIRLQVFETDDQQILAWYQAEDREFDKMEMVFQAMTASLLQSV
jgi:hypothetical protein